MFELSSSCKHSLGLFLLFLPHLLLLILIVWNVCLWLGFVVTFERFGEFEDDFAEFFKKKCRGILGDILLQGRVLVGLAKV